MNSFHDRRPLIAGILNFLLPGLGLLFLNYRRAAFVNFALVNLVLIIFIVFLAEPILIEHVHYLFLGLAAISAGYAHGVASSKCRTSRPDTNRVGGIT